MFLGLLFFFRKLVQVKLIRILSVHLVYEKTRHKQKLVSGYFLLFQLCVFIRVGIVR